MSVVLSSDRARPFSQIRPEVRIALSLSLFGWVWLLSGPLGYLHWVAMLLAMMLPTVVPQIAHVQGRSFAPRRSRAAFLFILSYLGAWIVAGGIAFVALTPVRDHSAFAPAVCIAAALWQLSAPKQNSLKRCHTRPVLRAFGRAADFDILKFGVRHAGFCMASCMPMMLIMLGSHNISVMLAITYIILSERSAHQPNLKPTLPALLLTAGLLALLGDSPHHYHMH